MPNLSPLYDLDMLEAAIAESRERHQAVARLGVRHETPQVILLRNGRPVWKASHFRITADELGRAVSTRIS